MKKLIIYTITLFLLFVMPTVKAQVLFSEDFDSYPAGHLNTDYTGTTPGQGGWWVSRNPNSTTTVMITPATGKGNVATISNVTSINGVSFRQDNGIIDVLWNNRITGNNILKFEYEFYGTGVFNVHGSITSLGPNLINITFQSNLNRIGANYWDSTSIKNIVLKNYNTTPFPYNTWIKAEMFIDYNTNDVYFYIPTLNLQATAKILHNRIPDNIDFMIDNDSTSVVNLDNIKLSALQTLPSYILSTNEQLAAKFNLYPNPASNVVNITNSENMLVNQVTIYDTTGRLITTENYNTEAEIQLNVENLASGTYLLYLQTTEGTAVKKLVKK